MNIRFFSLLALAGCTVFGVSCAGSGTPERSGNPIFEGWYADPEAVVYDGTCWVYPTSSLPYDEQLSFDCFSSDDLVHWTKHTGILKQADVAWARRAMWAPSAVRKDGRYYFFFAANDVHEGEVGGIGVAVSDRPEGPYRDLLGKPLINEIVNGAQPIDQFVYEHGGEYYMYYGGWGHCNVVRLKEDFTGIRPTRRSPPNAIPRGRSCSNARENTISCGPREPGRAPTIRWPTPCRIRRSDRSNASERSCGRTPPWLREPDITP